MSKALEDVINELYGLALDLLHQGQEEALKLAALIGKLSGVIK